MGNETKALLITAAKDALLEIVVLVADKISEAASGMRKKEIRFTNVCVSGDAEGLKGYTGMTPDEFAENPGRPGPGA